MDTFSYITFSHSVFPTPCHGKMITESGAHKKRDFPNIITSTSFYDIEFFKYMKPRKLEKLLVGP